MGIFDFLRKKKAVPSVSVQIEKRVVEVEIRQRTSGVLPLADVGGYVSPSGGFVNFATYTVTGVKADTGRKNTRRYEAKTEDDAKAAAEAEGLGEPYTVTVEAHPEPTERQMEYALDLGATIPEGVCKWDVSAIISRIVEEDEEAPDPGFSRWMNDCGLCFSRFVGRASLFDVAVAGLSGADKATLYVYAVYLQEKEGTFSDPRRLLEYGALRCCAEEIAADPALVKSLEGRDSFDYCSPNRGTKVYKAVAAALKQENII